MNIKLFLTTFSLIAMNCLNIGQTMLAQKTKELDTEINAFVDELKFKDRDTGINTTKEVIDWMANIDNITNDMRSDTLFDFTLEDFFSFLSSGKIIKDNDKQRLQLNLLWHKIRKAGIAEDFYWYNKLNNMLMLKESIENLKKQQNQVQINTVK